MPERDPFATIPAQLKAGRYQMTRQIGSGGVAVVWLAHDRVANRQVAIKVLDPADRKARELEPRFVAEAKVLHELRHPRIVRVLDLGREDGWTWFAMELVEGGNVKELLERSGGRLEAEIAGRIAFQVLQALDVAHRRGVVHRDVKPTNVLLDGRGNAKLADFGIARHQPGAVPFRTEAGERMGSFGYMAPEQRQEAHTATPAADFYGVGATLYAMLAGREPADLSMLDKMPELVVGLPEGMTALVRDACSYAPERRPADARTMAATLAAAVDAVRAERGQPPISSDWMREFDEGDLPTTSSKPGCLGWFVR